MIESVIGRISYVEIRGRWCDIIAANAHAPTENKSEDTQAYFYEELQRVLVQLPQYHMDILSGDSAAKLLVEIFKPTSGNESFYYTIKIIVLE